jgi:hypothetical protein
LLAPLAKLTQVNLQDNPLAQKNCPVHPITICSF